METETRKAMEARLAAIKELQLQPGWVVFREQCALTKAYAESQALNAGDGFSVAKHLGVMKAASDLASWPEREEKALVAYLFPNT